MPEGTVSRTRRQARKEVTENNVRRPHQRSKRNAILNPVRRSLSADNISPENGNSDTVIQRSQSADSISNENKKRRLDDMVDATELNEGEELVGYCWMTTDPNNSNNRKFFFIKSNGPPTVEVTSANDTVIHFRDMGAPIVVGSPNEFKLQQFVNAVIAPRETDTTAALLV